MYRPEEGQGNFSPLDKREVLEKVAAMLSEEWSLKTQDPSIRHIGPVAQYFNGAFGYGEEERSINMMDATGVTTAVLGPYEMVRDQKETIESRATQIQARDHRIEELEVKARATSRSSASPLGCRSPVSRDPVESIRGGIRCIPSAVLLQSDPKGRDWSFQPWAIREQGAWAVSRWRSSWPTTRT